MTPWERLLEWLNRHIPEVVSVVLVLSFLIFAGFVVVAETEEYEIFMEACLEDHKQYECKAMWRRGKSTVVPMPIFIPMGR